MATRNIVPRANGEGSLGTSANHWGNIYADNGTIAGRNIANDGAMLATHETEITNLQNQVTTLEHAYAGAKAAATVADMTDHNQIYVYVGSESGYTNGNWYYWNGTAWASGGVYQATALETDKTLTISGAAADAEVTGAHIKSLELSVGKIESAVVDNVSFTTGAYMDKDGNISQNVTYMYSSKIEVSQGQQIKAITGTIKNPSLQWMRFICAYNGDEVVPEKGTNEQVNNYVVPSGITHIVITCFSISGIKIIVDDIVLPAKSVSETIDEDILLRVDKIVSETIDNVTTTTGYMDKDGNVDSNTTYMYTSKIAVAEKDVLKVFLGTTQRGIRFVCAFNGDSVVAAKGSNIESSSYIVPAGITHVVLTCYATTGMTFVRENTIKKVDLRNDKSYWALQTKADSLNANTNIYIEDGNVLYNKKNCSYSFTAKFSTFTKLTIAHGKSYFGTSYIEIDNTNIKAYEGYGDTLVGTYAHGLTISDFISVLIKVNNEAIPKATIVITTANGQFIQDDVLFTGSYGDIYANSDTALTDVVLAYSMADLKKDIMIFGDSYISLNDSGKWPYYMMDKGYKDYMLCGYSGATSQAVLESFIKLIYIKRPKYILWLLGMNNNDVGGTYNVQWKNALDNVLSVCEEIGCIPILATIPNTPTVTNVYKNLVVKNSGYRYIDFAKAVNAESERSTWYPNMLSNDNVHPTPLGARVLAMRVLIDFPEIMVAE